MEPVKTMELATEPLPRGDELPCCDGVPMETPRHIDQGHLLRDPLRTHWSKRQDYFVGMDMFVYYSPHQVKNENFRGPDFFVVLGVPYRERKSWVIWEEDFRGPDVVVELLSESTEKFDKNIKKDIYEQTLKVSEYFWYNPFDSRDFRGFRLLNGVYVPIKPDSRGRLNSERLGLALTRWNGEFYGIDATWIRWETPEGYLLPTPWEAAYAQELRADRVVQEAELAQQEAELAQQEAELAQQEAELAQQQAELAQQQAELAQQQADRKAEHERVLKEVAQSRAERLARLLREKGIDPDAM